MIITLTSVGYGDLYPKTRIGQLVGVFISLSGAVIISLLVISLHTVLQFTDSELKSYKMLVRLESKLQLKKDAVQVLSAAFKHK